jgi:hypothetical protein
VEVAREEIAEEDLETLYAMRLIRQLPLILIMLLPVVASADSITVFTDGRVQLSKDEIRELGIEAKFSYELPRGQENLLIVTVPKKIDGREFVDVRARLFSKNLSITSFEVSTSKNEAGDNLVRINVNPTIVTRVKLLLKYKGSSKYEVNIELNGI